MVQWISIFHVKSEQYNGFSRGRALMLSVRWEPLFIFTVKVHKYLFERKNSCAARVPDQNPHDIIPLLIIYVSQYLDVC